MENKLEQLLNSLIEKGWKPFGKKYKTVCREPNEWHSYMFDHDVYFRREIASKESWLWQFVCQNDMVDKKKIWIYYEMFLEENWIDAKNYRPFSLVERLIIESALCDEDKLEDFLLSNINVNGTTK